MTLRRVGLNIPSVLSYGNSLTLRSVNNEKVKFYLQSKVDKPVPAFQNTSIWILFTQSQFSWRASNFSQCTRVFPAFDNINTGTARLCPLLELGWKWGREGESVQLVVRHTACSCCEPGHHLLIQDSVCKRTGLCLKWLAFPIKLNVVGL